MEKQLANQNLQVAVVTFEADSFARSYVEETQLPWPLLIDEKRQLYRAYGMERGHWHHLFGFATLKAYAKLFLRGEKPKKSGSDVRQLGGDVLIDPEGTVRLHHIGKGPADRPPVDKLVARLSIR